MNPHSVECEGNKIHAAHNSQLVHRGETETKTRRMWMCFEINFCEHDDKIHFASGVSE